METMEKAQRTVERLARTNADAYRLVLDHFVARQERGVRFARGIVDGSIREGRRQAEADRALTEELVGRAEEQADAYRELLERSLEAYTGLLYAPVSLYKEGLRAVEGEIGRATFPIAGYDELNVAEISGRLDGLTAAEIRTVREYERRNKSRETLMEQFDRKLGAASASA